MSLFFVGQDNFELSGLSFIFQNHSFLCQGNFEERHYFALAIVNGFLEFRFSMGAQPVVIRFVFHLGFEQVNLILKTWQAQIKTILTLFAGQGFE